MLKSDYYMYNYELENVYSETPSTPTVARVPLRNIFDQVPRRREYNDYR